MAYTVPSTPAARRRPAVVTAAVALLLLTALISVLDLVLGASEAGTQRSAYERAYEGTANASSTVDAVMVFIVVLLVINGIVAVGFALLALFNARGSRVARIITWVFGGLNLCCTAGAVALGAASTAMAPKQTNTTGPDPAEVNRIVNDALPSWYRPVTVGTAVIMLLAVLATMILLALPAANDFFRKPPAGGWEPAYPGGAPAYPAYPPYPGAPGAPGTTPGVPG